MPVTRRRLSPEQRRCAALDAARRFLLAHRRQAATLTGVAAERPRARLRVNPMQR